MCPALHIYYDYKFPLSEHLSEQQCFKIVFRIFFIKLQYTFQWQELNCKRNLGRSITLLPVGSK